MDFPQLGLIIFNIITPSIPEQMFYIYLTLYLIGKSDEISITSKNMLKMFKYAAAVATVAVLLRTFFPYITEKGYLMPVGILITWLSIIIAYRISGIKNILRAFVCTVLSLIANLVMQFTYIPLFIYGTGTDFEEVTKLGITTFIWSLPELVMIFAVISIIAVRKNMNYKVKFLAILTRNKVIMTMTIILMLFNVIFLAFMTKLVCFDKVLLNLDFVNQVLVIAIIVIFPIINVTLLFVVLYSNYYRDTIRVLLSKERMNTLVSILGIYIEEKNFQKVENVVNDLNKQVHCI